MEVHPLYREAVSVFYSPSRLGKVLKSFIYLQNINTETAFTVEKGFVIRVQILEETVYVSLYANALGEKSIDPYFLLPDPIKFQKRLG